MAAVHYNTTLMNRLGGAYLNTGLMQGRAEFVRQTSAGFGVMRIESRVGQFLTVPEGLQEQDSKHHIICGQFFKVQERIIDRMGPLSGRIPGRNLTHETASLHRVGVGNS
jgi:hypothetical protein